MGVVPVAVEAIPGDGQGGDLAPVRGSPGRQAGGHGALAAHSARVRPVGQGLPQGAGARAASAYSSRPSRGTPWTDGPGPASPTWTRPTSPGVLGTYARRGSPPRAASQRSPADGRAAGRGSPQRPSHRQGDRQRPRSRGLNRPRLRHHRPPANRHRTPTTPRRSPLPRREPIAPPATTEQTSSRCVRTAPSAAGAPASGGTPSRGEGREGRRALPASQRGRTRPGCGKRGSRRPNDAPNPATAIEP